MSGESRGDYLTTAEFERLRRRTETYREDLVVALAGRVGLRASEIARVRPADLREREYRGEVHYLVTVPEGDGETREAYVPPRVAHDLRKFATVNDVGRRDSVVDVSTRRVQMLVGEVADRTDDLRDVTCRDLRQHFARRLLVEEGVAPRVVQAVGGWASLRSLAPYLDDPATEDVLAAFADRAGRIDRRGSPEHPESAGRRPGSIASHRPDSTARRDRRPRAVDDRSRDLLSRAGALGEALADASTSEDVERAACDCLADAYRAVWICDDRGRTRTSAAPEGTDDAPADALDTAGVLDDSAASGPLTDDGPDVTVVEVTGGEADIDAVGGEADAGGPLAGCSLAVAPLRSNETVHGLFCVARETVSPADRTFLADAGRRVGRTLTAIARKQLLLADTGVELSLRTTDRGAFLVAASADLDCEFELEGVVPVEDHSLLYFVTVRGAAVGDVLERVADAEPVDEARLIRDYGDGALLEFAVSGESVASILVERGGTVRELSVEAGVADVTGVFSRRVDVRRVVEAVEAAFPETNLRSKREVEEPVRSAADVRRAVHDRVTDRQRTVLRAAYLSGYFEWPRGSTAEELAASMGVSSPTLHNHLRKAQQKVFDAVFDGPDRQAVPPEEH
ncbi:MULTISPECIES: bacterio-opsin activator domain-containing protein [Halorussus]|uniref:bacterio-opsin activator domain-containing protein n=1 Tax=Halorussus TaxID=1070314 RepID=UPI000E219019|nr:MULTISPECIES: bacterio-opsin activator domain-containing protein [Halorussus]NHN61107.1 tyrosine-type recombinase/integrase [Halorussus sp. JP-T4]